MALRWVTWACLAAATAIAQETSIDDDRTTLSGSTISLTQHETPTGTYLSFESQITFGTTVGSMSDVSSSMATDNATQSGSASDSDVTVVRTSTSVTFLTGSKTETPTTVSGNMSVSSTTSAAPTVTNTQPCNNYPEFCMRKYSNITEVGCHNSPFVTPNNLAANQQYDVISQLNDGVRFLQAQIQWPTGANEPHFCHTSCDILDAGPITDWLTQVKNWVAVHPYDVVTILLGNGNYSVPSLYVPHIEESGILRYVFKPSVVPMKLNDWPTLNDMILQGQRVVMFLDYMADPNAYPWLLDEFSNMWETPFDPVDQSFPCTVQRPPDLPADAARDRLYLLNHNLNIELSLLGVDMLVPARAELNLTNNITGHGSLGAGAEGCAKDWGHPPKVLNVDYYNMGGYPGSVFEVAAEMNNVTYDRPCCGQEVQSEAAALLGRGSRYLYYALAGVAFVWALS